MAYNGRGTFGAPFASNKRSGEVGHGRSAIPYVDRASLRSMTFSQAGYTPSTAATNHYVAIRLTETGQALRVFQNGYYRFVLVKNGSIVGDPINLRNSVRILNEDGNFTVWRVAAQGSPIPNLSWFLFQVRVPEWPAGATGHIQQWVPFTIRNPYRLGFYNGLPGLKIQPGDLDVHGSNPARFRVVIGAMTGSIQGFFQAVTRNHLWTTGPDKANKWLKLNGSGVRVELVDAPTLQGFATRLVDMNVTQRPTSSLAYMTGLTAFTTPFTIQTGVHGVFLVSAQWSLPGGSASTGPYRLGTGANTSQQLSLTALRATDVFSSARVEGLKAASVVQQRGR